MNHNMLGVRAGSCIVLMCKYSISVVLFHFQIAVSLYCLHSFADLLHNFACNRAAMQHFYIDCLTKFVFMNKFDFNVYICICSYKIHILWPSSLIGFVISMIAL